jgi:hypothetical protein
MANETNGSEHLVKTRTLNWKELVLKKWGKDWAKPDPGYEFSNGRKFETPKTGGPYGEQS